MNDNDMTVKMGRFLGWVRPFDSYQIRYLRFILCTEACQRGLLDRLGYRQYKKLCASLGV